MTKRYSSAIDPWFWLLAIGLPVGLAGIGIARWSTHPGQAALFIFESVVVAAAFALLTFPCVYTITHDRLIIRCGVNTTEIPLRDLTRAERSCSLWSAPALSLRRVKITYGSHTALVSPRDRDAFIADLLAAAERARTLAEGFDALHRVRVTPDGFTVEPFAAD